MYRLECCLGYSTPLVMPNGCKTCCCSKNTFSPMGEVVCRYNVMLSTSTCGNLRTDGRTTDAFMLGRCRSGLPAQLRSTCLRHSIVQSQFGQAYKGRMCADNHEHALISVCKYSTPTSDATPHMINT